MFTFTFYKHGSMNKTVVSGHKYSIEGGNGYTVVAVHPEQGTDGECYYIDGPELASQVNQGRPSFRQCWVTNTEGRTIDRIEPSEYVPELCVSRSEAA